MSKPTAGQQYIVVAGDTLQSIAARAYGDSTLWPRIQSANQSVLKEAGPGIGDVLNIPLLPEVEKQKISTAGLRLINKPDNVLTIIVGGRELLVESATIFRSIDTAAHGFKAVIKWSKGDDPEIDRLLSPYSYTPASAYIGNQLLINGVVYLTRNILSASGSRKEIEGWSFTADIVDSFLEPPYEESSVTLRDRAESLVTPKGIGVIYDVSEDEFFDRVTARSTQRIFDHLADLASQRGILVSATPEGELLFTKSATGSPVGTLEEGGTDVLQWTAEFDGRARYNAYKAIGQSPSGAKEAIAIDPKVPKSRFMVFNANDTKDGNMQLAADHKRSKQLAVALTNEIPVSGWYAPDGNLWRENTLVTVISETLEVSDGFTFLIRAVQFDYSVGGKTAILSLVPPQVYTGAALVDPWS